MRISKQKVLFLDRDGIVLKAITKNGKPYPPEKFRGTIKGIDKVIKKAHEKGYLVIVVTNQPDVGEGITRKETVERMNEFITMWDKIDYVFTCYHKKSDNCICRKPKTGLFAQADWQVHEDKRLWIDFSKSIMVGDRWKDIEAGKNAGCTTIFVDYDYDEIKPITQDYTVKNVKEILNILEDLNND